MRIGIDYGREHLDLEVQESNLVNVQRELAAPALADPVAAVREALESPLGFPPLRRALTPDDHVAIVLDEGLPRLPELLTPILEHLTQAQVEPGAVTLIASSASTQPWLEKLPDSFQEVRIEVHDPTDRKKLSYLAATKQGRRLYLNRTTVDADQVVVLTRRGYDPLLGYSGAEGALYPALSDVATQQEMCGRLSSSVPGETPWPVRQEAAEVAWLLGAPFFVQVIEGAGDEIIHVLGGLWETSAAGQKLLDARWRLKVDRLADTVIAGMSGDPAQHSFTDLARALACAARVVQPGGRIVLLTQAEPQLGPAGDLLRQADDPQLAIELLRQHMPVDMAAAQQWASTAQRAQIYLLSRLPAETAEELFTTPLETADQAQRLLSGDKSCLVLPDCHKTLAVVKG